MLIFFNIFFIGLNFIYFFLLNRNITNFTSSSFFIILTIGYFVFYIAFFALFYFLMKYRGKIIRNFAIYMMFILSSVLFFLFLRTDGLRAIFYVVNIIMTFFNFLSFKSILEKKENYFTEETDYFTFLISSFLFSNAIFSFNVFLGFNKIVLAAMILLYFFIFYYLIYSYRVDNKKDVKRYVFISSLISMETFIAITYLPHSYYVCSALVLIFTFFVSSFGRDALLNKVDRKYFKKMLLILSITVLIIFLTAKMI